MQKPFVLFLTGIIILITGSVFAQEEDNVPYLSDDDIAAIELVLPEDIPEEIQQVVRTEPAPVSEPIPGQNEMSRLNTFLPIYHLLIVDRRRCPANGDIGGISPHLVLYNFKHHTNGYLIVVYQSPAEGPVFPQLPENSRILVDLATARPKTLIEYIDSSAFRVFVTNRDITADIRWVLERVIE
jgi:hypothetical protein